MEEKILKFAVEDINKFVDDEDAELAIAHLAFLSTRKNSHNINITEDLLRRYAPTILGKFLVGKMDSFESDVMSHEKKQNVFGYIPSDQEIKFEEKDGAIIASCDVVVSKLYATEFYTLFTKDNFRNASVEMSTSKPVELEDGSLDIKWFKVHGCTVLNKMINGSCPDANITMVQFSEKEANTFYRHKLEKTTDVEKFAEEKTFKINKTELKEGSWGDIDKTNLRNKIMEAKNKTSLVHAVYALVESGWEEAPSEHLKYPLMQEIDGTFYYNRNALSSALAYAKQEGEQSVITKVNSLYKKFNLNDDSEKKGEPTKMEKDKILEQAENESKENAMKMSEQEENKKQEQQKMAESKENETVNETADKEQKMSEESALEKFAEVMAENKTLTTKLAEKEALISEQKKELDELRKFSEEVKAKEKDSIVSFTLAKIKGKIDEDAYKKYEESGKACKFEEVQSWKNGILAEFGASMLNFSEKEESTEKENITRMEIPKSQKENKSIWDNL